MSTEQQVITSENTHVQQIVAEMLDGRSFYTACPARWRADVRAVLPAAIADLALDRARLAEASDIQVGQAFEDAVASRVSFGTYSDAFREQVGGWLRDKAALFEGKPGIPDYPTPPTNLFQAHTQQLDRLRLWADNPTDDLRDGVDEQATLLLSFTEPAWPEDDCRTTAEAKAFLGRVMDYKRARLAPLVPEVGMSLLVDEALNQGAYFQIGSVIEVTETGGWSFQARGTCEFEVGEESPDSTQGLRTGALRQYHLVAEPVEVATDSDVRTAEPEVDLDETNDTLRGEVQALRTEVASLREQVGTLNAMVATVRERHADDIDAIGEALIAEAKRRDWCDEYDQVIERLNRRLNVPLPTREDEDQDYDVEVTGWIRVPFTVTVSVTAAANADSSDVEDAASEVFQENYSGQDLLRNYTDSYQAEVEDDPEFSVQ